jgi:hypothetical protein
MERADIYFNTTTTTLVRSFTILVISASFILFWVFASFSWDFIFGIIGILLLLVLIAIWVLIFLTYQVVRSGMQNVEDLLKMKENSKIIDLNFKQIRDMVLHGYTYHEGRLIAIPPKKAVVRKATLEEQRNIEEFEKEISNG